MNKPLNLLLILFLISNISYSQTNSLLSQKLAAFKDSKTFKHGQWSVSAEYVDNGEEIISLDGDQSLAPASGLKIFTSCAALCLLGEDYTFKTRIYYDSSISNGILNGNIYLVGGGDPALGSNLVMSSLPLDSLMMKLTKAVKEKGIKKISGSVLADELLFDNQNVPDYYPWIDIGNYYGAGTSALTINDNLYYLFFKPALQTGETAEVLRTEPLIPNLQFINYMKTGKEGSGDNGYIYCAPGQYTAVLRGTIPAGVKEFSIKGSLPDPALFAVQYFSSYLNKNGIEVINPADKISSPIFYDENKLILTIISPPLKDIVYILNKKSFNLYAEHLLKTIGLVKEGKGSTDAGIRALKNFLESNRINIEGLDLYDGSGLSRTNTVTAKMMVKLLSFMTKQKGFNSFYNSLGIAGDPDDISSFKDFGANTILAKNARIKSGLINGVRSHSGYLKDRSGRLIAFSMIANNYSGSVREVNEIHKKVLLMLADSE